jgi:hypothetical protein
VRTQRLLLVTTVAMVMSTQDAWADSTTCREGTLVVTGDRIEAVLAHCGNPSWRRVSFVHDRRNRSIPTELQEWVYDLGPGTFLHYLRFRDGVLELADERSRLP